LDGLLGKFGRVFVQRYRNLWYREITDKGFFINKPSSLMSEDQYNEAGDHARVRLNLRAIDEVLMGMLRDLRKRVSKIRTAAICCFSRSFTRRHGFKISCFFA
jgi:hypothetical protein